MVEPPTLIPKDQEFHKAENIGEELEMSFFCKLSGRHYWSIPHRTSDKRLVQVCYECGSERPARELQDDFAVERLNHAVSTARANAARLSSPRANVDRVAVGDGRPTKFLLVK